jgi:hypothetical protein
MIRRLKRSLLLTLVALVVSYGISFSQEFHTDETIWYDYFCPEDTHTYDYASIVVFCRGVDPDSCPVGAFMGKDHPMWPDSLFWSHTLPSAFLVPPCVIFRARLWINGKGVNNEDDSISIQGVFGWEPLDNLVHDNTTYDLTEVSEAGFWNQGFIDVIAWAGSESLVRLDVAKLLLDYDCPTDVEDEDFSFRVKDFRLSQNYPNPFNPETKVSFSLPERAPVSLAVYNVFGQKVRALVNATLPAGSYTITWDGTDNEGNSLASGVYFCRLCAGKNAKTSKMILMK